MCHCHDNLALLPMVAKFLKVKKDVVPNQNIDAPYFDFNLRLSA